MPSDASTEVSVTAALPLVDGLGRGSQRSRPLLQTLGLTTGRAFASAISLIWMIVIARSLPAADVGALSLGLTLAVALSVFADLGLPMIVADRLARHPGEARALISRVVRLRLLASVATAVLLVAMFRLASDQTLAVPFFMAISIAATSAHSTATAGLRGLGVVFPDVANEVLSRIFVLVVGSWMISSGRGIGGAAAALAMADTASALVLLVVVRKRSSSVAPSPDGVLTRTRVIPLAAALAVGSLHSRIDVWLLALLGTPLNVAHYAIPARLAEGLLLPASAAAALVLPLTAREPDERARGRAALRYTTAVVAVVAVGGGVLGLEGRNLLALIFGKQYGADAGVLRLLCLAAVPSAVSVGLAPMVAILRRGALIKWFLVALGVNVVANTALIPSLHEAGAAWASLISMMLLASGLVATVKGLPGTEAGP